MAEFTRVPTLDDEPQNLIDNLIQAETILLLVFAAFAVLSVLRQVFGPAGAGDAADDPQAAGHDDDHGGYEDHDGDD